jgi:hypothetical protein
MQLVFGQSALMIAANKCPKVLYKGIIYSRHYDIFVELFGTSYNNVVL